MSKKKNKFSSSKAFTILELLTVIATIGILSSIIILTTGRVREAAYLSAAKKGLSTIYESVESYVNDQGDYPPDVYRGMPPGLEKYLSSEKWPNAPWPGSVYDWDNWTDEITGEKIYQISVRFCPLGNPEECIFPNQKWAKDFGVDSAVYYCISGPCRSHINQSRNYPGYCVNC